MALLKVTIYKEKIKGPKTELCGTQHKMFFDEWFPRETSNCLLITFNLNHSKLCLRGLSSSQDGGLEFCDQEGFCASALSLRSFTTWTSAFSVLWLEWETDWNFSNDLYDTINTFNCLKKTFSKTWLKNGEFKMSGLDNWQVVFSKDSKWETLCREQETL